MRDADSLVLLCDGHGNITQVLHCSYGESLPIRIGIPFARLAIVGSLSKALSFIHEINHKDAVVETEINVLVNGEVKTLHFSGGKVGEQIFVVGAGNRQASLQLFQKMALQGSEQTIVLPDAVQAFSKDEYLYTEISRLNNELVAMQREVVKKNCELQTLNQELEQRVEARTAQLQTMNAELSLASRQKDEFLAMISHELRTPLNAILNFSEALQEQIYGHLNEKQIRSVSLIENSGRHLLGIINDILDVSRMESGNVVLSYEPVDIHQICQSSLAMISGLAQKKKISVAWNIQPDTCEINADPRRLKQILVNLLSNAVKFTLNGGQVGLDVRADIAARKVLFTVWDTGIGISPDDFSKLFRPFYQIDGRLSREYEGTGLGLILVKHLVSLHGGSVGLESTPGEGSKFTVMLPFSAEWTGEDTLLIKESGISQCPAPYSANVRLLLVDQNTSYLSNIAKEFLALGYQVDVARNGEEGLRLAMEKRPDVVVLDFQKPDLDGFETIRKLREIGPPEMRKIVIIALTALAIPGDREKFLEAGADEYLRKPVYQKELEAVIFGCTAIIEERDSNGRGKGES